MTTTTIYAIAAAMIGFTAVIAVQHIEEYQTVMTVTSQYGGVETTLTMQKGDMRALCQNLAETAPFGPVTPESTCGRLLGL